MNDYFYYFFIGLSYSLSIVIIYINISTSNFKKINIFIALIMAAGFISGGYVEGFFASLLVAIRNYLAFLNIDQTYLFMFLGTALFLFTSPSLNDTYISIFPLLSVLIMTYAFFKLDVYWIKFYVIVSSLLWIVYLYYFESYLALFFQIVLFLFGLAFWLRMFFEKVKHDKLPEVDNVSIKENIK